MEHATKLRIIERIKDLESDVYTHAEFMTGKKLNPHDLMESARLDFIYWDLIKLIHHYGVVQGRIKPSFDDFLNSKGYSLYMNDGNVYLMLGKIHLQITNFVNLSKFNSWSNKVRIADRVVANERLI